MNDFTHRLLAQIDALRAVRITKPVVDPWLSIVDPPLDPTDDDISRFAAGLAEHARRWDALADRLDAPSRAVLTAVLLFRAVGCWRFTMPWVSDAAIAQAYDEARAHIVGPSAASAVPPYDSYLFAFDYLGEALRIEAWLGNIAGTFIARQYHHQAVSIRPGDVVIDAGACFGDTALAFAVEAGPQGRVISFEPSPQNWTVLQQNLARNPALGARVTPMACALSDQSGGVAGLALAGAGSRLIEAGADIQVRTETLDALVRDGVLTRADFIKMDIEFHEAAALHGAAQLIRDAKPRLAIAAYHRPDDVLTLSEMITTLRPDYELHLGHITASQSETVLFAV